MKRRVSSVAAVVCVLTVAGCGGGGEQLEFGGTATVDAEGGGKIQMTVLGIDEGATSDLDGLQDSSRYAGKTPYYLRYAYAKTADGKTAPEGEIAVFAGDRQLTKLSILPSFDFDQNDPLAPPTVRRFDKCRGVESEALKKAATGQRVEGCGIYLADSGMGEPTKVELTSGSITDAETFVTWTR
jgi:hypothetical protein